MCDELVVGVNSDAAVLENKGPSVLNIKERCEILKHCKFVDEINPDTEYEPTVELLKELKCGFYAHGDDPCFLVDGRDLKEVFRSMGMYKEFKRTEGVSTTNITGKLLALSIKLM